MADVFISYSRRNLEFVHQLVDALKTNGKDPWFDQLKEPLSGIAAGAPWWEEIKYGIENAENFLFVVSPDSIHSPYCHAEIAYAREHGKRLVPVLYCGWIGEGDTRKAIDAAIEAIPDDEAIPNMVTAGTLNLKNLVRENWLAISEIQYVSFASSIPFEQSLTQLTQALDLDLAWVRMYSQLRQAAQLWVSNNRSDGYLWSAERLKPAYDMIERRKPALDALVQSFIEPEHERLLRKLDALPPTVESHESRRDIGDRLGVIGDTRPGVGVKDGIPDMLWLPVTPGGEIRIKNNVFDVQPFYIAKYLLTFAQYQAFVAAEDGYNNPEWWEGLPMASQHDPLAYQRTVSMNNPRDSISWHQSVAFTRWLNAQYQEKGLLPEPLVAVAEQSGVMKRLMGSKKNMMTGAWVIRLPSEWEWQWAAQAGKEAREHPWGKWDDGCADTSEAGLGRAVAVGLYGHGAAACGALDMAGNLWEWCLNDYDEITQISLDNLQNKVLLGGSFRSYERSAAVWVRNRDHPFNGYDDYGFRVVVSSPIPAI